MDNSLTTTVIVDVGGHVVRFGTASSEIPTLICSPCISKKIYSFTADELIEESPWFENAIKHGIIKNWSIIEDLMKHFLEIHSIEPEKSSIIFTQSLASTEKDKEKAMDILFDKFGFHSVCILSDAYLSFIASGKSTGCIVQLGHSITQFLPIVDDKPLLDKAKWYNVAGSDISNLLISELDVPYNVDRNSPFVRQKLDHIKEGHCFVASDFEAEINKFSASNDNQQESPEYFKYLKDSPIARKYQQMHKPASKVYFEAPEVLFEPSIIGKKEYGIVEQLYETIASVKPMGFHGILYSNIILSGGTSLLKGLKDRFASAIDGYSPKLSKINVSFALERNDEEEEADEEEGYVSTSTHDRSSSEINTNLSIDNISLAAFKGAVIFSQRPDFSSFLISKEDRPFLRRNRSRASVQSVRSSYRKSNYLSPDFV